MIRHHHAPLHRVNLAGKDCARMPLPVHPLAQRSSAVIVILPAIVALRCGSLSPSSEVRSPASLTYSDYRHALEPSKTLLPQGQEL